METNTATAKQITAARHALSIGAYYIASNEQHAIELVEDGHREGGEMFELLDEMDRLSGNPPRSRSIARERGWTRRAKGGS